MTKEWYISHGYRCSVNIEQAAIDRAERDVMAAYVSPLIPTATGAEEGLQPLIADIAFLLILQRSLVVTRKGTKVKTDAQSVNESVEAAQAEQAKMAALALGQLQELSTNGGQVTDICELKYKTKFFGD